jgi:hypothetical protein
MPGVIYNELIPFLLSLLDLAVLLFLCSNILANDDGPSRLKNIFFVAMKFEKMISNCKYNLLTNSISVLQPYIEL